jgi:3-oxoacyl-[acyl-carrier protein] reductase
MARSGGFGKREQGMAAKVAIVTGGARGIGRGCALELAAAGFDIALVDLLRPEMERTRGELEALGRRVTVHEADVAEFARAGEVVRAVREAHGRLDVLVNNAGRGNPAGILEITEESFDRTIAVNLKSCFNYIRHAAPIMLEQGAGRIISMSSLNAFSGGVTAAVSKFSYAAAKAGILGMTRALAKELGPSILVNAICPGVIETELGNAITRARGPELARGIALQRLGTPADVAKIVGFLAASEPCFITGQAFQVDGFQFNV